MKYDPTFSHTSIKTLRFWHFVWKNTSIPARTISIILIMARYTHIRVRTKHETKASILGGKLVEKSPFPKKKEKPDKKE